MGLTCGQQGLVVGPRAKRVPEMCPQGETWPGVSVFKEFFSHLVCEGMMCVRTHAVAHV